MAEETGYKLVEKLASDMEVRHYKKQTWVQDHNPDSNASYMKLLAYSEGQNKENRKVPQTVPVINGEDIKGPYVAFLIPCEIHNPPEPLDPEIEIRNVPERKLATISLSGLVSPESFDRDKRVLENTLKNRGIKIKNGPIFFQYNKPWTPPLEQKNEIAFEI